MRKSTFFLLFLALQIVLMGLLFLHAFSQARTNAPVLDESALLVKKLELTDLSLFTEARYTRHLSQADMHTAFQDHPLCLEHFPSGSLVRHPGQ
ncbi:MAG: hypothetical protein ACM34I_10995 [bacterium]